MFATTNAERVAILSELADTGNEFALLTLHLYVNDITPDVNTVVGDFVEASAAWGYAAVAALVFGIGFIAPDGNAMLTAPSVDFVTDDVVTPETVYGYYLTDAAGTKLIGGERFDEPKPMGVFVGQGFTCQPAIVYGG